MSGLNQLPAPALLLPVDATAASPAIQIGGGVTGSSGTGVYGDAANIKFSVGGVLKATIDTNGITAAISGTASLATSLAGGSGGTIPYQSAANTTQMLANGSAGDILSSQGTTVAPHWIPQPTIIANLSGGAGGTIPYQSAADTTQMLSNGNAGDILSSQGTTVAPHWIAPPASTLAFNSAATAGSNATETVVVTGVLATDTLLSVSQSVPGANNLPLIGFNTLANNAITLVYSADPGAGAVVVVSVKR